MDDASTSRRTTAADHAAAGADAHADGTAASRRGTTSELHGRSLQRFGSARVRDVAGQERDRAAPARDREHAVRDRLLSMGDRATAIAGQQLTDTGDVCGVLARTTGVVALRREIDRAHRTGGALTVVYVAVDPGDVERRPADRDAILRDVAAGLVGGVRSYDLVIAVSPDGFVCALCDATISTALERFAALEQTLAQSGVRVAIGYTELAASDTPGTLIDGAAADAPWGDRSVPTATGLYGAMAGTQHEGERQGQPLLGGLDVPVHGLKRDP